MSRKATTTTTTTTITATDELRQCIETARAVGCPEDQVRNILSAGVVPLPWQWGYCAAARLCDLGNGPVEIAGGGSRGPGKSYIAFGQVCLDDCQRMPGLKFLFLRSLQRAARESFLELEQAVLFRTPHEYKQATMTLEFPNGSHGILGGYENEKDIDKYLGLQYDVIVLEERTLIPESAIVKIKGSLRTAQRGNKLGWRERVYSTTNPAAIGHAEFKRDFVMPYRENRETSTRFIPATYRDNPYLSRSYIEYLESLEGDLGKKWRDGDWDVFEGMAFTRWNEAKHVIEPFEIPAHWPRYRGIDWGSAKPFCCLWGAKNPDNGRWIIYREAYHTGLTDQQQARLIKELTHEYITMTFADPSMWTTKNVLGVVSSSADEYAAEGVPLLRADNDRLSGKRKVDRLLADMADGIPGLLIFRTCVNLIRTLPTLPYDKTHVEDVDTNAEDHSFDSLRYLLTSLPEPAAKQPARKSHPLEGLRYL